MIYNQLLTHSVLERIVDISSEFWRIEINIIYKYQNKVLITLMEVSDQNNFRWKTLIKWMINSEPGGRYFFQRSSLKIANSNISTKDFMQSQVHSDADFVLLDFNYYLIYELRDRSFFHIHKFLLKMCPSRWIFNKNELRPNWLLYTLIIGQTRNVNSCQNLRSISKKIEFWDNIRLERSWTCFLIVFNR